MDSSLRALSTIQLFSDFDQVSLKEILDGSLTRSFPSEVIVLWENEPSPGIHLVRSGWLKAVRSAHTGREQVLNLFGPGDSFSVISALSDALNQVCVISLEEVIIQIIPRELIFTMLDRYPESSHKLIER